MSQKLLISNLPLSIDSSSLEDLFTMVGDVQSASVECDASTGQSTGVGRVEMSSPQQALDCIARFNGQATRGHVLAVREDKPHTPVPRRAQTSRQIIRANKKRQRT